MLLSKNLHIIRYQHYKIQFLPYKAYKIKISVLFFFYQLR